MKGLREFVLKTMMKGETGIVKTLPKKELVEFNMAIIADKLMRNGFDPDMFKNADQVFNTLKQIDDASKARKSGITETQSAKVFDLKGKEIKNTDNIMGGEEVGMFDNIFNRMQNEMKGLKTVDDQPPPGSKGGKDDIAAPVQSAEETLKNMIMAENKKNIAAMKQRKMLDEAIDDASPGFSGDR